MWDENNHIIIVYILAFWKGFEPPTYGLGNRHEVVDPQQVIAD
jgi:hypothetical protein